MQKRTKKNWSKFIHSHTLFSWAILFCDLKSCAMSAHSTSQHHSILTKALAYFSVRCKYEENRNKIKRIERESDRSSRKISYKKEHNHEMGKSYKIFIYVENAVKKLLRKKRAYQRFASVDIRYSHATCLLDVFNILPCSKVGVYLFTHARWFWLENNSHTKWEKPIQNNFSVWKLTELVCCGLEPSWLLSWVNYENGFIEQQSSPFVSDQQLIILNVSIPFTNHSPAYFIRFFNQTLGQQPLTNITSV